MLFFLTLFKILPLFIIIFVGYIFGKVFFELDNAILNKVTLWIAGNVLAFTAINSNPPRFNELKAFFVGYIFIFALAIILPLILKKLNLIKSEWGIISFALMFSNGGYLGYPVVSALFGEEYIAKAVMYVIVMTLLSFSIGIIILTGDIKKGLKNMIKLPMLWGFLIGWILGANGLSWEKLPFFLHEPLKMIKEASIVIILINIGVSLSRIKIKIYDLYDTILTTTFRLIIFPVIAVFLVRLLKLDPILAGVFVIEVGMPVGMNVSFITEELEINPALGNLMVFISTLISIITVPLLYYLISLV
ncbi:AEC family transporter [Marinitoga aeolica]|uniref:AEC family transporter n=1 Tax=Marinitoga aeolica TaxID=2809031 RepID=A0ABY8PQ26_9BACT|nr:AEC family transporter [Marinitoga aeolica]WGS64747.1 AEC family transporter [Marinitoga aeolica]